jgi:hypothetical protein
VDPEAEAEDEMVEGADVQADEGAGEVKVNGAGCWPVTTALQLGDCMPLSA